jgi:hypothetical protein
LALQEGRDVSRPRLGRRFVGSLRARRIPVYAASLAVLAGAAALTGAAAGAPARSLSINCPGYLQGSVFSAAGHSTHVYGVEVEGVSCAFARPWVSRLVTEPSSGALHAPPGWTCLASPGLGRYSKLAAGGGCGPGMFASLASLAIASTFFGWHALV